MTDFFKIQCQDSCTKARTGILKTAHGDVRTPVFMPVGTQATVKGISSRELLEAGVEIVLSNTYHLYLRPGERMIEQAGGLHRFMAWDRPLLTDSGGFQVFSLSNFRKVKNDGVEFKSHIDGSRHFLTPEDVVRIQTALGSDILMPLDECVEYPAERSYIEKSVALTTEWARRSKEAWIDVGARSPRPVMGGETPPLLFGIVQGGMEPDLRKQSAEQLVELDFPGYAIGGLSVGEPTEEMVEMLRVLVGANHGSSLLPENKPRYLMGVGMPLDLLEAVSQGVDMFDCVVPTRNGRHGTVFTPKGRMLLRESGYSADPRPIDEKCPCYACRTYSRAYLRHLFNTEEHLGGRLASLHNITFFIQLLASIRKSIEEGRFLEFRKEFERHFERSEKSHKRKISRPSASK